jgi:CheY-like chemotaxis protein
MLDYQLPGINDLELAARLHAAEALKSVPIPLMSANFPTQELERHSIAPVEKPFAVETLLQTIELFWRCRPFKRRLLFGCLSRRPA